MISRVPHISAVLLFLFVTLLATGASDVVGKTSSKAEIRLREADRCRRSLYGSNKKMKYRQNWLRCIRLYDNIHTRHPKSAQAPWALYRSARMRAKLYGYSGLQQDLDDALDQYRSLVKKYEDHRIADDAQYRIGEIFYKQKKDLSQAYVEFLKVDIKFPSGDMRPEARKMLDKLAALLSKKNSDGGKKAISSSAAKLAFVKDIRHWSTPTYTRVVIDVERPVKYASSLLKRDLHTHQGRTAGEGQGWPIH
jgi:N-acetylmuramoyl-L-alanine amidase